MRRKPAPVPSNVVLRADRPERWRVLGRGWGLLFLLVLLAYFPALGSPFFYDDGVSIVYMPLVRQAGGIWNIWFKPGMSVDFYPVVVSAWWLQCRLWGLAPMGYHVVNLLLAVVNAGLLWLILRRLGLRSAWLVAALFAIHPLQVETVAWISEQKNLISGLFYLLALYYYSRFSAWGDSCTTRPSPSAVRRFYALAVGCFILALLSKPVTLTLPVVLLVIAWWRRGRIERRDWLPVLPLAAAAALMTFLTIWFQRHYAGTLGPGWEFSLWQRTFIAGRALGFYVIKLFWPHPLSVVYPRWDVLTPALWQYLYPLAVILVILVLWLLRRRTGRGPLSAVAFYIVTLAPALGFVSYYTMLYSFVADHYQYLACIGMLALAAEAFVGWVLRHSAPAVPVATPLLPGPRAARFAAAGILVALALLSLQQTMLYRHDLTIWQQAERCNHDSWAVQLNLGCAYGAAGNAEEALTHLDLALQLEPKEWRIYRARSELFGALAETLPGPMAERMRQAADADLARALQLRPKDSRIISSTNIYNFPEHRNSVPATLPSSAPLIATRDPAKLFSQALALEQQEQWGQAVIVYRTLEAVAPNDARTHYNLGNCLLRLDQAEAAIPEYKEAVRLDPGKAQAYFNLGTALASTNRTAEAAQAYRKALALDPALSNMVNVDPAPK